MKSWVLGILSISTYTGSSTYTCSYAGPGPRLTLDIRALTPRLSLTE